MARSYVGEYVTSLEMAGASITVMLLDDELQALLGAGQFAVLPRRHGIVKRCNDCIQQGTAEVLTRALIALCPRRRTARTRRRLGRWRSGHHGMRAGSAKVVEGAAGQFDEASVADGCWLPARPSRPPTRPRSRPRGRRPACRCQGGGRGTERWGAPRRWRLGARWRASPSAARARRRQDRA